MLRSRRCCLHLPQRCLAGSPAQRQPVQCRRSVPGADKAFRSTRGAASINRTAASAHRFLFTTYTLNQGVAALCPGIRRMGRARLADRSIIPVPPGRWTASLLSMGHHGAFGVLCEYFSQAQTPAIQRRHIRGRIPG